MAEDEQPFEIELQGVEREVDVVPEGAMRETFEVTFHCARPDCWLEVRVSFDVKDIPTLEVMPRGMAAMRQAFVALAAQSAGWGQPDKT